MKKQIIALAATTVIGGGLFSTAASAQTYTVQKGDTLWGISQKNSTTVQQLKSWNNLSSDLIFPNQRLEVNGGSTVAPVQSSNGTYTVKAGDTLGKIAAAHGLSVSSLKALNGLSSHMIYPGDQLAVAGNAKVEQASKPAAQASTQPAPVKEAPAKAASSNVQGKTMTVTATAYTAQCNGCSGVTATGINLNANRNAKVIAVDPNVIPLGSKVHVEGYGTAIAGDTGGAIKGNKIDLHMPTKEQAYQWGVRSVNITILD
ncbi:LysM peptidoglycan-binding and 3D domain-containing protein [Bacillus sp. FJAT-42315]|uniref:LysM peptidoglycan-binding and 3D domain-containing protein n=1 Tax=Bacillus sp. FJAT-42315 TaxID=2014077 RepID=UPI000C24E439|nr:3D domain-containing protein [Bacillus sp. FJAT-42315]